ncbi:MAG: immunoglobulin domain-containing protein [Candidatus Kapaibacteriales bacterium]
MLTSTNKLLNSKTIILVILLSTFQFLSVWADTYSVSVPDSPGQYDYNYNTYDELGWEEFTVSQGGVISQVTVSYTWDTDYWPDEGSFYLQSPSGTSATIGSGQDDGNYNVTLNNFNNQNLNGTWRIWIQDSFGDGGHQATNITITFTYSPPTNMTYQSSNCYQITDPTGKGLTNQVILRIEVVMSGSDNPLSATSFSLSTTGTSNTADIANAKLYYTGTSNTFSTSNQFGATVNNPSGNFTITGSQQLQNGTNYFWLTYDIASNATVGNVVDATCNNITIGGTGRTPTTTSPSGNRTITYLKIYCESFDATTFPPTGWQTFTTRGTSTRVWERVTSGTSPTCSPHSGAGMAYYNSYSISSNNAAALVTPLVDLSQRGSYPAKVRFWMYRDPGYSSNPDSVIVYINTSASTSGATRLGAVHRYYSSAGWQSFEFSIPSSFNGNTNYIIFEALSGYGNNMFIDDVCYDAYPDVMRYSSSTTSQITGAVGIGFTNQPIIRLEVTMQGAADPLSLTSITFNTNGTTNTADISSAKVYYTGTSSTFSTTTQFGSTVNNPSGTFTISGNQQLSAGINYFWLVYDVSSSATDGNYLDAQCTGFVISGNNYTPSVTNPSGSRQIRGPRIGTYTVGTGGYYPNLTEAFNDINSFGMKGDVTLQIISDINETAEIPPTLNQWTEYGGSNYYLTITPSGGTRTIYGSYGATTSSATGLGVIVLNGADRVIIDGGSGRNLTIRNNASTMSYSSVIRLISLGVGQGCKNVTIRNCNIIGAGNSYTNPSNIYVAGIYLGGTTMTSAPTNGYDHDFVTIENNVIKRAYYGILVGSTTSGNIDSLKILNNIIGADQSSDYIGYRGIYLYYSCQGAKITGNRIYNIKRTDGTNLAGIEIGSYCSDVVIDRNQVYGIYQESSGGWGAWGISISSSTGNSNIVITNNFISDLHTINYSGTTYNPFGIRITGGTNFKIYHNTVHLYGNQANISSSASTSACLLITTTAVTGTDLRNNIFFNELESSISGSKMYAVYVPSGYSFSNINYNDYYVSGNYGILGYYGSDKTSLSDWRTSSGQDNNSINVQPYFLSNDNLHLTGQVIGDSRFLAPSISSAQFDFDGETRRSTTTIGADEVIPLLSTTPITFTPNLGVYCKDGNVTMSTTPSIVGYADGINRSVSNPVFEYQWQRNNQDISGANSQNFTIDPISQTDSANYSCVISFFGETTSTPQRNLKVESPIVITQHPQNSDICADLNPTINLTSISTGTIIGWQWQKQDPITNNWFDIPGANQPDFIAPITNPQESAGNYRVVVLGPGNCGPAQVVSDYAVVEVTETIKNNIIYSTSDLSNICELEDFSIKTQASGTIVRYIWQKLEGGIYKDLDINKFPSATSPELQFQLADPSMSGRYRLVTYGSSACYPTGEPVISNEVDVTVWPLFRIVEQPKQQSVCPGQEIMMYVLTEGVVLSYQWQKDGQNITDNPTAQSAVLIIPNAQFDHSGVYTCKLTIQDCRGIVDIFTEPALVYVHSKTKITSANKDQIVKIGEVATFTFDAHAEGTPPNFDVFIQWYRGNQPLVDNDRISGSKSNILTIRDVKTSDLGTNYWVVISGMCGSDTAQGFSISAPDINITQQPQNIEACEGTNVTFSVTATPVGGTSLSYQWRKNGQPLEDNSRISGSTTNTLTITNVNQTDNAVYDVQITNHPTGFTKNSAPANLIVKTKPTITQEPPVTLNLNAGDTLTLSVEAEGTEPLSYQWFKDNESIPEATNPTFQKENVTSDDAGTYHCVISNECGSVVTQTTTVTVTIKFFAGLTISSNEDINIVNIPNPFSESTLIQLSTNESGHARLVILDNIGNEIAKLFDGTLSAGITEFKFNPKDYSLSSGIYLAKFEINGKVFTKVIVLRK